LELVNFLIRFVVIAMNVLINKHRNSEGLPHHPGYWKEMKNAARIPTDHGLPAPEDFS